ncbi:hypothetical protein D3C87_1365940 [compost metagenome]
MQPGIVQRQPVDLLDNAGQRIAGFETLLAVMQEHAGIHVLAAAQAPGVGAELDFFIGKNPQVGQHELRPILVKIAKEHQAQAITQPHDGQAEQSVIQCLAPEAEASGFGKPFAQCRQPIGLLALGLIDGRAKALEDFGLEQHLEQFRDRQRRLLVDPAQRQQRAGSARGVADLGVLQLARPKVYAPAHDHPYQQRPGGSGQLVEIADEPLLLDTQHIGIAMLKPINHLHEVVQVVERVVEGICSHR